MPRALQGAAAFYGPDGKLLPQFEVHIALVGEFATDLKRLSQRAGELKSKLEALKYKERFERTERIAPFLIDPDKVKQAEEQRAAKLSQLARRRERLTGD